MVRIEDFHIQYDQKWSVYNPGDLVTGKVFLRLNAPVYCDAVQAHFYGSSRVFWVNSEFPEGGGRFRPVAYNQERIYFNEKKSIWNFEANAKKTAEEKTDERPHLAAGSHTFEFAFQLPDDLPTSFDSKFASGYVRHFVKIALLQEGTMRNSRKQYFTVVQPADLNAYPECGRWISQESHVRFPGDCCIKVSGDVHAMLTIAKTGYVPGEPIYINCEIENDSGRSVRMMKASLLQIVTCYSEQPIFEAKKSIHPVTAIAKKLKVPKRGGHYLVENEILYVPAVVPTFQERDVIEASYELCIELFVSKDASCLHVSVPIRIGSVPIEAQSDPVGAQSPPPYQFALTDCPPPSYEESQLGRCDNDQDDFLPRYTYYRFTNQ